MVIKYLDVLQHINRRRRKYVLARRDPPRELIKTHDKLHEWYDVGWNNGCTQTVTKKF